jgi:hypothetical protein
MTSVELEQFIYEFKETLKNMKSRDELLEMYNILYTAPDIYSYTARFFLCFGCGELVDSRSIKRKRFFQLYGKWHCEKDGAPVPGILVKKTGLANFARGLSREDYDNNTTVQHDTIEEKEDKEVFRQEMYEYLQTIETEKGIIKGGA